MFQWMLLATLVIGVLGNLFVYVITGEPYNLYATWIGVALVWCGAVYNAIQFARRFRDR